MFPSHDPAGGQAGNIQSKFRVIESNVFPKLSTLGKKEGVDLLSGYTKITEDVKKIQTRGGKFTAKKGFNVNKIGELIKNLQEHVKQFPEDKPIANAILFNLENGSRPSLTTELRTVHYIKNQLGETGALKRLMVLRIRSTKSMIKHLDINRWQQEHKHI